jgi:2,5-diamino-6-(ribosylamino)-4(3H)-pyrimidinone 5'-phosphate reductase
MKLPFVFLNVATTADGKLAPGNRHYVPFSSKRDQEVLMELRTDADAVMAGARTVAVPGVTLGPGKEKYRKMRLQKGRAEHNIRIVVTGSGRLDPELAVFRPQPGPLIILTTERISKPALKGLSERAEVRIFGEKTVNFREALAWLAKEHGVKRLLCEGGGEINAALFEAGLVDEIYMTLCPVIFGGRNAPTLADGEGVEKLSEAIPLELKKMKRVGDELFLVYKVKKGKMDGAR